MKQVISTEKVPIKMWLDEIEEGALAQAKNLANLPFAFRHVALLSDCHVGFGMPIGGVLATRDVVIPNSIGVDIGCGMCAVKTSLVGDLPVDIIKQIRSDIKKAIPVGMNKHAKMQDGALMPNPTEYNITSHKHNIVSQEFENARKSLGTLGGGNHFIEVQKGNDGYFWIMIHSGSRNLGKKVADHYNNIAKELNTKYYSSVPKEWDLAFLPLQTEEAQNYLAEMQYCVDFALANRNRMIEVVKEIINKYTGATFNNTINIAHNYAAMENHFGHNVLVHRKGATRAYTGELGIIPGSQGTSSYIVVGKGNIESFKSCSHGAGRKMGRKQAKKDLVLAHEIMRLDVLGVIHDIRTVEDLDEAAGAYKDISVVMENQTDLVDILVELKPVAVVKG